MAWGAALTGLDEQELPQNQEAEQSLLGAILIDNRTLSRCRDLVAAEDFYVPVHGRIWSAILEFVDANKVADVLVLRKFFEGEEALEGAGGGAYLARLAASAVSLIGVADYARAIRDLAHRRRLIEVCEDVAADAYNPKVDEPASEIAARAVGEWQSVASESDAAQRRTFRQAQVAIVEGLKERLPVYSTGLKLLDEAMSGGLMPSKVYGFIGRKKTGKTILGATISKTLNAAEVRHLFIAAEMGSQQISERMLAHSMGAYSTAFVDPRSRASREFQNAAAQCATQAKSSGIFVDAPGLTFERLRRHVTSAYASENITGVVLDYFQLVGGQNYGENQAQHLDNVAQWIADIARELSIWFVVLAQENQSENVRGGEGLRMACDQVYRLCREERDDGNGDAWLEMIDTRYTKWADVGSEDEPALRFNPRGPMFENAYGAGVMSAHEEAAE